MGEGGGAAAALGVAEVRVAGRLRSVPVVWRLGNARNRLACGGGQPLSIQSRNPVPETGHDPLRH